LTKLRQDAGKACYVDLNGAACQAASFRVGQAEGALDCDPAMEAMLYQQAEDMSSIWPWMTAHKWAVSRAIQGIVGDVAVSIGASKPATG
jgi:hypothetical protein